MLDEASAAPGALMQRQRQTPACLRLHPFTQCFRLLVIAEERLA